MTLKSYMKIFKYNVYLLIIIFTPLQQMKWIQYPLSACESKYQLRFVYRLSHEPITILNAASIARKS